MSYSRAYDLPDSRARQRPTIRQATLVVGGLLAVMWVLEGIDSVALNALDSYGIEPRKLSDLPNILWSPFLHFGWAHLISNSVPFLVLGVLTYLSGRANFWAVWFIATVASGLTAWFLSPVGSITAGASGVIFGYLSYLLVRGFFARSIGQIMIAVIVFVAYGSVLLGVIPGAEGISWQAHLGGAVGGVVAAWWLHGRERRRR